MKRIKKYNSFIDSSAITANLLIALLLSGCLSSDYSPGIPDVNQFSLYSLNIHYLVPDRDRTDWENRKHAVSASINELSPDIILFQEMETFEGGNQPASNLQLDWILRGLESYSVAAYGDPEYFPITQPILVRKKRFHVVDEGFFFFSDTPDIIYSRPWKGYWPAFTTWVYLEDVHTQRRFYVYNIHLDAFNKLNRKKGIELIGRRIEVRNDVSAPVILAGDFNMRKGSQILHMLEAWNLRRMDSKGSSFHFGKGLHLYSAIDHLFTSPGINVAEGGLVQKKWKGYWPSDHHPLAAILYFDSVK